MAFIPTKLRNYFFERGLGAYLALVFSALSVMLTLILVGVIGIAATDTIKMRIGNGLAERAAQASDELDHVMFERYREVYLMAMRDDLGASEGKLAQRRLQLEALQETYPYYAWIDMTDINGKIVASTKKMPEGVDVSERPWFRNALSSAYLSDVHEAKLLTNLLPHSEYPPDAPISFVDVAFGYRDKTGKTAGVLDAHLSWRWAKDVARAIIAPMDERRHVESLIVSKDGKVLLGPAAMQGKTISLPSLKLAQDSAPGYTVETWPDGKRYLVGYSSSKSYQSYPGMDWSVLVRQSEDDAFSPLKKIQKNVFWSGIAVAILFSLLGVIAARRIVRPLRALAQSAQRIQNGESADISLHGNGYFEVKALTASLNSLVGNLLKKEAALKELNLTLEKRVELRTAELAHALSMVTASENRVQSIVESAQEAFIGVDVHGNIIGWNTQAEKMFGWRREEVIGRQMSSMIIPPRFKSMVDAAIREVYEKGIRRLINRRMERLVVDRRNNEFPVEITISLVQDNESYFFSALLHDISARKEIERMKNEFISTVSHELRTPLTSIHGSIGLLVGGVAGDLPLQAKTLLEIANKNGARLVRMINDVLDIEKIESGNTRFEMENQGLLPLAQQAIEASQGYAAQFNVTLALEIPVHGRPVRVSADRDWMIQVLINLLSNAIKFSPVGGTVTMRIRPYNNAGVNWVRVSVIDQGGGIPKEFRTRIFQKFAMADSADSRKKGGTGLGLSISKSLVEQHGGRIDFVSEAGSPTEFFIDLPLVIAAVVPVTPPMSDQSGTKR